MVNGEPAERIGGWLLLLVGVIGVLMPFGQITSALSLLNYAAVLQPRYGSNWQIYSASLLLVIATRTVICLWVAWRLVYRKTAATPHLAIIGIWIALGLLGVISLTIGAIFTAGPYPVDAAIGRMIWPIGICVIATVYLVRSKRVANTYRKPRDDAEISAVFE